MLQKVMSKLVNSLATLVLSLEILILYTLVKGEKTLQISFYEFFTAYILCGIVTSIGFSKLDQLVESQNAKEN